jgi:hypothetical protein
MTTQSRERLDGSMQKLDSGVDVASKLTDTFMTSGATKTVSSTILNKLGMLPNMYSAIKSYNEGDMGGAFGSGVKVIGSMGTGGLSNMADGVGNAIDMGKGFKEGDYNKMLFSGVKLGLNVAASGSAPAMAVVNVTQFTYQQIKSDPEGWAQFNRDSYSSVRNGFDDTMGPTDWTTGKM